MRSNQNLTELQKCFSPPWHLFIDSNFENRSIQSKVTFAPQIWVIGVGVSVGPQNYLTAKSTLQSQKRAKGTNMSVFMKIEHTERVNIALVSYNSSMIPIMPKT